MPVGRYRPFAEEVEPIRLPDRTWPDRVIDQRPAVVRGRSARRQPGADRPDEPGPQAPHVRPAGPHGLQGDRGRVPVGQPDRLRLRPRASSTSGAIPDDVTIQVLTQCRAGTDRAHLRGVRGVHRAIVHFYNSTSILQRRVVFRADRAAVQAIATDGARKCVEEAGEVSRHPVALRVLAGVLHRHRTGIRQAGVRRRRRHHRSPTPDNPIIFNLPATVEMATPNVYADSIEWMSRNLANREIGHPEPASAQRPRNRCRRSRIGLSGRRRPDRGLPVRQR